MKTPSVIIALAFALLIGYLSGHHAGYSSGYDAGLTYGVDHGYSDGINQARATDESMERQSKLSGKAFNRLYELEHAPRCYGHPKNWREVEEIMQFNSDENAARLQAIQDGTVKDDGAL